MPSKDNILSLLEKLQKDKWQYVVLAFQQDKSEGYSIDTHAYAENNEIFYISLHILQKLVNQISTEDNDPYSVEDIKEIDSPLPILSPKKTKKTKKNKKNPKPPSKNGQ